ncbi:MAG: hypothetical protein N4A74_19015 [Carboxylicivirga sp.]|nr:hypothetical protein [Carboxylicivirga sp.]
MKNIQLILLSFILFTQLSFGQITKIVQGTTGTFTCSSSTLASNASATVLNCYINAGVQEKMLIKVTSNLQPNHNATLKIIENSGGASTLETITGSGTYDIMTTNLYGQATVTLTYNSYSDLVSAGEIFKFDYYIESLAPSNTNVFPESGKIGINTLEPQELLHVEDGEVIIGNYTDGKFVKVGHSTDQSYGFTTTNGDATVILNQSAGTTNGIILGGGYADDNNTLFGITYDDGTQQKAALTLTNKADLEIKGNATVNEIKANSIKISANGQTADFVFEETYELKSLSEVEKFIQNYKHLEGVPSASEMESDGVNLMMMNKVLLQKIEELTLYMIQFEKEKNDLQKQIIQLKESFNE